MSTHVLLQTMTQRMNEQPEGIQNVKAVYQFDLKDDEGVTSHQVGLEDGTAKYAEGTPFETDCTLQLSDENFIKLAEGKLNPAMMTDKLKLKGNMVLAAKLQSLLKHYQ
ncbi:SCP-2 sterol transfer family protein [Marininema mesophilum]|uniref:SCP-2 sterol transfer family protein n=1 Tax=Marininema mesophilum TaxID=1048340 RepID=A0A1H2RST3_9BACL|nr:SCP2 sterol-binding domain-containing protein [Marininema mesophilum]SDW22532.1 SCP-2 sterol transfer family protein [Marininema mesophilum]